MNRHLGTALVFFVSIVLASLPASSDADTASTGSRTVDGTFWSYETHARTALAEAVDPNLPLGLEASQLRVTSRCSGSENAGAVSAPPMASERLDSDSLLFPVAEVFPVPGTHSAWLTTTVPATCNGALDAGPGDSHPFVAPARQTGLLKQTFRVDEDTIVLDPIWRLNRGELAHMIATRNTLSFTGLQLTSPTEWSFQAETLGGTGVFADSGQRLGTHWSTSVALGDLNGNGCLDAIVGNHRYPPMGNRVWINDCSGAFSENGQALGTSETRDLALGDLNGNGSLDLFVANSSGEPDRVWLNDGEGSFYDSGQALGNSWSTAVALGDVDGDGHLDAVVATLWQVQVWMNNGAGQFWLRQAFEIDGGLDVALGDLDGNGSADIFIAAVEGLRVWLNDGTGYFAQTKQEFGGNSNMGVALGDLNDNGHLDAFVVRTNWRPHEVWLNDGTGFFTKTGQQFSNWCSCSVALGDLNGNGYLDAYVANCMNDPKTDLVWFNDGEAYFEDSGQRIGHTSTQDVALGDLDLDGDLDAFVAVSGGNRVYINLDQPTFAIGKTGPRAAVVGEAITYTLSITNTGQLPATGVVITDTTPEGAIYLRGGTRGDGTVTWSLNSLEPGSTASVEFAVKATVPTTLVNDNYWVTADGGYGAGGEMPVVTTVTDVPIAGLAAANDSPTPLGEPTELTAGITDGTNVSYTWKLDDQHTAQGASVSHTYSVGTHTSIVTATNSVSELTATTSITVDEAIIELAAVSDSPTAIGDITTLTATVSAGSHVSYTWLLGDGQYAAGDVIRHSYPGTGLYTAVVTATNSVSTQSAKANVTVDAPIKGLAVESSSPITLRRATTLTATVNTGTSISYLWDLGDGSEVTGRVVSHIYPASGRYLVVVTATNWLDSATASTTVEILDAVYLPVVLRHWPPVPYRPELNPINNPDQLGRYTIAWQQGHLADTYVLEEATEFSFSDARVVYQGPQRAWTVPHPGNMPGTYYYRVKARNSWGDSAWSNVVQTTVSSLPPSPTPQPTPTPSPTATPVPCYAYVWGVFRFGFDYRIDVVGAAYDVEVRVRWTDCPEGGWFERRYVIPSVRRGFPHRLWVSSYGCREVVAWVSDYRCP